MIRDLKGLETHAYDILVIGGGIYGACIAHAAALRGLSVALVEQADFGSATSSNSLKTIHGGFRYLQHADVKRMRESIVERRTLMRIAPHLVHLLPVLIPTYGHTLKGREIMGVALRANDIIGLDRNRAAPEDKRIGRGRTISRAECLAVAPGLDPSGLTGGAIFYDAQAYNSERLLLAFLRSAADKGAQLANYVAAIRLVRRGQRVAGIVARDNLTGDQFVIRARMVVNAAGPWVNEVISLLHGTRGRRAVAFAKAVNVVTRPLFGAVAVGLTARGSYRDRQAIVNRGTRLLFVAPWRGRSLVGTLYAPHEDCPEALTVTEEEIQSLLDDINIAYPPATLRREDVSLVHGGLVPMTGVDPKTGSIQLSKSRRIWNHAAEGAEGLLSVVGVKYTTARQVAEDVVGVVFDAWQKKPPPAPPLAPLYGGEMERFDVFLEQETGKRPGGLDPDTLRSLLHNYGAAYPRVLAYMDADGQTDTPECLKAAALRAEVIHGVREEMAQTLGDVVFRRTELGTAGHPGSEALRRCARVMGAELGWSESRIAREIDQAQHAPAWRV